jgi:hypothetical protein
MLKIYSPYEKSTDGKLHVKLQIGKRDQETELTGRSSIRWRRSALDCSFVYEEEEVVEEEKG